MVLRSNGLIGSMGRVSSVGVNAEMESFFALLHMNVVHRRRWTTREELRLAIATWIEWTYHRHGRQRALGKPTPIKFETIYKQPAFEACEITPREATQPWGMSARQSNSGQSQLTARPTWATPARGHA